MPSSSDRTPRESFDSHFIAGKRCNLGAATPMICSTYPLPCMRFHKAVCIMLGLHHIYSPMVYFAARYWQLLFSANIASWQLLPFRQPHSILPLGAGLWSTCRMGELNGPGTMRVRMDFHIGHQVRTVWAATGARAGVIPIAAGARSDGHADRMSAQNRASYGQSGSKTGRMRATRAARWDPLSLPPRLARCPGRPGSSNITPGRPAREAAPSGTRGSASRRGT
jgi:hypothetical protein